MSATHEIARRAATSGWTSQSLENILAPTRLPLEWHPLCSLSVRHSPPRPGVTQPAFDDPAPPWLLGCWRLLRSDPSLDFGPGVRMEFQRGGHLRYILSVDGRELVVPLVYRTTGDLLETDNPAASHVMSTRFTLGAGDMLILDFAGAQAIFIRER